MRITKLGFPLLMLLGGSLLNITLSFGKVEYTKKEKKPCTTCHTKMNTNELNDVGKCYEKEKKLDACKK